ncbi:MAG: VOC family protein [Propionibacteriales bacterium]|nr:VOC family protein [Propionibacteriales bacterium]
MTGERSYAILPCLDLDEALSFYAALGFTTTYEQRRPNPYAVVAREDIAIHLSGIDGFDPETSVCGVIITVPNADELYDSFRDGLRARHGKVPVAGIPRLLRPRRKAGTATGFSVVDVGGNWLRIYRADAQEESPDERRTGLGRAIDVAARHGDARGADETALGILDRGLARHDDADPATLFEALLYRIELLVRLGRQNEARTDVDQADALIAEHQWESDAGQRVAAVRDLLDL